MTPNADTGAAALDARDSLLASKFLDEVADWLLTTHDPRLDLSRGITDVCGACADFCEFLAGVEEAGGDVRKWRDYLVTGGV